MISSVSAEDNERLDQWSENGLKIEATREAESDNVIPALAVLQVILHVHYVVYVSGNNPNSKCTDRMLYLPIN